MNTCKTCGAQLEEGTLFCTNCGAKLEETPAHGQLPEGTTFESSYVRTVPKEDLKKSKSKKKMAFGILAALVFVVAGTVIALASINKNNAAMINNPDVYLKELMQNKIQKITEEMKDMPQKETEESSYTFDATLELSPTIASTLSAYGGLNINSIGGKFSIAQSKNDASASLGILLNNVTLLTLDIYSNLDNLYARIPELSSTYLMAPVQDLLETMESKYGVDMYSNENLLDSNDFSDSIPTTDEIKSIITRYSNIILRLLDNNVTLEKDFAVNASEIASTYNKFTVKLTEGQLYDTICAIVDELEHDTVMLAFIDSFNPEFDVRELSNQLSESISDVDMDAIVADYIIYVDKDGNIKGQEFVTEDGQMGYLKTQNNINHGVSAWMKEADTDQPFIMNGSYTEKNNVINGNYVITVSYYDSNYQEYSTVDLTISFNDLKKDDENKTSAGTLKLSLSSMPGSSLGITFDKTSKKPFVAFDVNYMGMAIGTLTLACEENEDVNVTKRDPNAIAYDILSNTETTINTYLSEIDIETFAKDLESKLGIDIIPIIESIVNELNYSYQ